MFKLAKNYLTNCSFVIAVSLILCIAFTLSVSAKPKGIVQKGSGFYRTVSGSGDNGGELKAFRTFLENNAVVPEDGMTETNAFSLDDINNDNVMELCVYENADGRGTKYIYAYTDGTVRMLDSASKYAYFCAVKEAGLLINVWERWDRGVFNYMRIFNGTTINDAISREYWRKNEDEILYYDARSGEPVPISEDEFNELYSNYLGPYEPVPLFCEIYENTDEQRRAVLGGEQNSSDASTANMATRLWPDGFDAESYGLLLWDTAEIRNAQDDSASQNADNASQDVDTASVNPGDYIIPESSTRPLTEADVAGLSAADLRIARNEIYARHGRKFKSQDLQDYFNSKGWYFGTIEADDFKEEYLSALEKENIKFIEKHET